MDAFGIALKSALNRGHQLAEGSSEVLDEVRLLEMMVSHYNARIQELVIDSAHGIDLFNRQRSAGAAVVLQDVVHDLERRIKGLKAGQSKIAVALGS